MLCFRCGSYNVENAQKCSVCGQGFVDASGRAVGPPRRESKTAIPASIFVPGELVAGRYRIADLLGQGAVGSVYRARDLELDRDVALKAITPNLLQTEEEQRNFSRQIKSARKLQHPNIVRIFDEGHEGNRRFYTMKLLEGLTLRKIIRLRHEKQQAFAVEEVGPIFQQLAAALDHAHQSTWHGDLKPENIIVLPDLLKVTDFNLVKALPLKPFLGVVKTRSKGFPYIAPELRVEARHIDGRVDVYAMGVILAEMLTGLVYEGHFTKTMAAALEQLPTRLEGLVRRALTEHPDGRVPTAGELSRELDVVLATMSGPLPPPASPPNRSVVPGPGHGSDAKVSGADPPVPQSAMSPPPLPSSDHSAEPLTSASDEDVVEIGQSQVVLLDSSVAQRPPALRVPAGARQVPDGNGREGALDDTVTDGAVVTMPRGTEEDASRAAEGSDSAGPASVINAGRAVQGAHASRAPIFDALTELPSAQSLVPPPLPSDGDALDHSGDHPVMLAGDDDDLPAQDEEPTGRLMQRPIDESEELHDAHTAVEHLAALPASAHGTSRTSAAQDLPSELPPPIDPDEEIHDTAPENAPPVGSDQRSTGSGLPPSPPPLPIGSSAPRPRVSSTRRDGRTKQMVAAAAALVVTAGLSIFVLVGRSAHAPNAHPGVPTAVADAEHGQPVAATVPGEASANADPTGSAAAEKPSASAASAAASSNADSTQPDSALMGSQAELPEDALARQRRAATVDATGAGDRDGKRTRSDDVRTGDAVDDAEESPQGPSRLAAVMGPTPPSLQASASLPSSSALSPSPSTPSVVSVTAESGSSAERLAVVGAQACPKGMAYVPSGSFTFGSSANDPMRNFGEASAVATDVDAFCIDYYEQPNGKDALPTTGVSWQAAKNACERAGRRLCSEREWERACKGDASARFPYGNTYDVDVCNTEDADGKPRALASASAFKRCRSPFKVFMLSGNAEEWVSDTVNRQQVAKGGAADRPDFSSRCSARRTLPARTTGRTLGFRCCASPALADD